LREKAAAHDLMDGWMDGWIEYAHRYR
jgi:hypothetical protein